MKPILFFIAISALLSSCGSYTPSSSEKAAKETTLREIQNFERNLRVLLPDLALMAYPGTPFPYLIFRGNYVGMESSAEIRYATHLSGLTACEAFRHYLKNQHGWDTTSYRGECSARKIGEYQHLSIDGRKFKQANTNDQFTIHIEFKDYDGSATEQYLNGKTLIEIWIYRTMDRKKSSACITDQPPDKQPCRHADWQENLSS